MWGDPFVTYKATRDGQDFSFFCCGVLARNWGSQILALVADEEAPPPPATGKDGIIHT